MHHQEKCPDNEDVYDAIERGVCKSCIISLKLIRKSDWNKKLHYAISFNGRNFDY